MIEVKGLSKKFDDWAVKDISFTVKQGQIVGFLGPNGAGKSTTMKMLTGFLTPTSGQIYINGLNVGQHALKVKSLLGYLPEGAPLYPDMLVIDFLSFIAELRGIFGKNKKERLEWVAEKINLKSVLYKTIDVLSKGYKRRVGLASAIIHNPKILILDEPTDGLDPNQKHEVRKLIESLSEDKVIILSTHILEEVEAICDRAIVISNGEIVADSTPHELLSRSPYHNTINLKVDYGDLQTIQTILRGYAEVGKIEIIDESPQSGTASLCLHPSKGYTGFSLIAIISENRQAGILDLVPRQGRLDEVFRLITHEHKQVS